MLTHTMQQYGLLADYSAIIYICIEVNWAKTLNAQYLVSHYLIELLFTGFM